LARQAQAFNENTLTAVNWELASRMNQQTSYMPPLLIKKLDSIPRMIILCTMAKSLSQFMEKKIKPLRMTPMKTQADE